MKIRLATLISSDRRWYIFTILLILFTGSLFVKNAFLDSTNNPPKIGPQVDRPAVGTRGLGLSRAYISNVNDATSPLWNPAGLASLDTGNIIYDLSQGSLSFAYPINPIGTFGINILDLNYNDRFLVNHTSNPIGTFEIGYNQALLSYGRKIGPIKLGASTGYTRAPYKTSLWAPNYDVGALMNLSQYSVIGIHYRDINGVVIPDQNGIVLRSFDPNLSIGTTIIPHPVIRWHSCYNITSPGFGTSIEFVSGAISANVGSLFSFDSQSPVRSWSLGLSFKQWGKETYYTYLNEDNLNYRHLLSIGITFGEKRQKSEIIIPEITTPNSTKQTQTTRESDDKTKQTNTTIKISPDKTDISQPTIVEIKPNSSTEKSIQIAKKHNIEIELMLAIIYVESKFNPVAVSKSGAGGLMQMVPGTARELGLRVPNYSNKLNPTLDRTIDERFDTQKNLETGLIYFNKLREKYLNNLTLALGAYNVGPGKVKVRGPLISRGRIYANKVLKRKSLYRSNKTLFNTDLNRLEALLNN
ncbi:hypothetical protein C6497_15530 [Candidatus Poribacteria bacterium]|nr:MAG: hypothetical protein C6497_15530 [Candidatus Poribacteria bacterium]